MKALEFRFLGPLEIRCGDRRLPKAPTLESHPLLRYLVLHRDQPQPRERLGSRLWGDRPENRVRASLSTTLWHIRRFLHRVELILSDSHTVQFDPQSDVWLDVEAFEVQVSGDETASLESAVALYRGDFVDGFTDYWIIGERFALQTLFLEALARVMVGYEARGEYQAALTRYPLS